MKKIRNLFHFIVLGLVFYGLFIKKIIMEISFLILGLFLILMAILMHFLPLKKKNYFAWHIKKRRYNESHFEFWTINSLFLGILCLLASLIWGSSFITYDLLFNIDILIRIMAGIFFLALGFIYFYNNKDIKNPKNKITTGTIIFAFLLGFYCFFTIIWILYL
ncbi:uncharacterized membrane protein YidH (DUF202 family) [Methanobacterium oryzae]